MGYRPSFRPLIKKIVKSEIVANGGSSGGTGGENPPVGSDVTPPVEVTNLASSNITGTNVTLSWDASTSSDIKEYRIYNGDILLDVITGTSYTAVGLAENTDHTFKVIAVDLSGNASTGVSVTARTKDITSPANVSNLSETHTQTSISLIWNNPVDSDFSLANVYLNGVLQGSSTNGQFNINSLTAGTTYSVKVTSVDTSGNESVGTSALVTTATPDKTDVMQGATVTGNTWFTATNQANMFDKNDSTFGTFTGGGTTAGTARNGTVNLASPSVIKEVRLLVDKTNWITPAYTIRFRNSANTVVATLTPTAANFTLKPDGKYEYIVTGLNLADITSMFFYVDSTKSVNVYSFEAYN